MPEQISHTNTKEIIAKALEAVEKLPYSDYLTKDRVSDYLRNVLQSGENVVWHINRLYGFGASEIGSLVADVRNRNRQPGDEYEATFKSARQVISEKLMYKLSESDEKMLRGKKMEPLIAELFINQLREAGHTVERADDVLDKLKKSDGVHSEYPWLKGKNIDDAFYIDGKLILVDYKAPSTDAFANLVAEQGGLSYQAQLNQYDLYAKDKGIHFDGLCLVPFDYYTANTSPIFLDCDGDLQKEILQAGDLYWNEYVLQGRLPSIPTMYDEVFDPESVPEDVYKKAAQFASLKAFEQVVSEYTSASKKELEEMFKRNGIKGNVAFELGAVTASSKKKLVLNEDGLEEEAARLGIDTNKYSNKGKLSYKRLYNAIEKMAKSDDTIYMGNLAHIEQAGSVRRVSDAKPCFQLWEAVLSEGEEFIKNGVRTLTERQMSVLDHIKNIAHQQKQKVDAFQALNTMVEKTGPLKLEVEDILDKEYISEGKEKETSTISERSERAPNETGHANRESTKESQPVTSISQQVLSDNEDFVVDFDDEIDNDPAPGVGLNL